MERTLSVEEAAGQLGCSVRQCREMIVRGVLRGVNIGLGARRQRFRVLPSAVEEFLAGRECGVKAEPPPG